MACDNAQCCIEIIGIIFKSIHVSIKVKGSVFFIVSHLYRQRCKCYKAFVLFILHIHWKSLSN